MPPLIIIKRHLFIYPRGKLHQAFMLVNTGFAVDHSSYITGRFELTKWSLRIINQLRKYVWKCSLFVFHTDSFLIKKLPAGTGYKNMLLARKSKCLPAISADSAKKAFSFDSRIINFDSWRLNIVVHWTDKTGLRIFFWCDFVELFKALRKIRRCFKTTGIGCFRNIFTR